MDLKKMIQDQMTADHKGSLQRCFEIAKVYIRLSSEGSVEVLNKDKFTGTEQILLYLIGKLYSKEAGYSETEKVTNEELMVELGIPKGSLAPWLMNLRNAGRIKQEKDIKPVHHSMQLNMVEKTLNEIKQKHSR